MLRYTIQISILIFLLFNSPVKAINDVYAKILQTPYKSIKGGKITIDELKSKQYVLIILNPSCPICQNYTLTLNELNEKFKKTQFIGVFGGTYYKKKEIAEFVNKYNIEFPVILDKKNEISKTLSAQVTPEVFLIDDNKDVVYKGAIDNWIPELGKKRDYISEHFLESAIIQSQEGRNIEKSKTDAIGCKIQY